MADIDNNAMYALFRDVQNGSLTIDDAMTKVQDIKKSDMQYEPPEKPIQESEVAALIEKENNMSNTTNDDSTEITSKTYVDEVVTNDEVPTPTDVEAVEEDTKRDEKVADPEDGPEDREPEEKAEEKPAYKSKRAERRAQAK